MLMNPSKVAMVALFLGAVLCTANSAAAQESQARALCDRACLTGMIDRYLEALVAHDPARAPLSPAVRFAQDNQPLQVGEALWITASGVGTYRHYFADPERGDAGLIGVIYENGKGAILLLHLKVEKRQITEAEQWVAHDPAGAAAYEERRAPEPLWSEPIPVDHRQSREALESTAYMYFQALEKNDGKGVYPFTDDCQRSEDGLQTSNRPKPVSYGHSDTSVSDFTTLGCKAQFQLGFFGFTTGARDRRFLVVDPEYGAVLSCAFLEFDGSQPDSITLTDGRKWKVAPYFWTSRTNQLHEGFRRQKRWRNMRSKLPARYGRPVLRCHDCALPLLWPALGQRQVHRKWTDGEAWRGPLANPQYTRRLSRLSVGSGCRPGGILRRHQ
jgi:hypothetical protein